MMLKEKPIFGESADAPGLKQRFRIPGVQEFDADQLIKIIRK